MYPPRICWAETTPLEIPALAPKDSIKDTYMTRVKAAQPKNPKHPFRVLSKLPPPKWFVSMLVACSNAVTHCSTPRQAGCQHRRKPIRQLRGHDAGGRCNVPSAQPSGDHPSSGDRRHAEASFFFHWHERKFQTTLSTSLSASLPSMKVSLMKTESGPWPKLERRVLSTWLSFEVFLLEPVIQQQGNKT